VGFLTEDRLVEKTRAKRPREPLLAPQLQGKENFGVGTTDGTVAKKGQTLHFRRGALNLLWNQARFTSLSR